MSPFGLRGRPTSYSRSMSGPAEAGRHRRQCLDLRHVIAVYVDAGGIVTAPKSDLPQGTLDLLILKVVALGPLHGYAIAQRLQQVSREVVQVQQGTLYPALHRLENRGHLSAEWKTSDTGRSAKFYKLTRKGRALHGERSRKLAPADRSDWLHPEVGRRGGAMTWWARLIRPAPRGSAARRRASRSCRAPGRRLRAGRA